ncbi:hypothetical protein QBC47DRAFT_4568 [Echria macrotheca]|uniref:Uncharacterized protein n=1 Tax=Echria macrotheca TaxID=438768 RepID=A0AAJ0BQU9_9PEZI|nr:hypothetical protein QBC47DRAFT_4568 [Echria macrotheca]
MARLTALVASAWLLTLASCRPQILQEAVAPQAPQHTAVYTVTITPAAPTRQAASYRQVVTTAVVTVMMPRDQPNYPREGELVVGTIISNLAATYDEDQVSRWSTAQEAYWTLTANPPPGITGAADPWVTAHTTLTSAFTSVDYTSSSWCYDFAGRDRVENWETTRVTLVEPLGAQYPQTIVRAGYTHVRWSDFEVDKQSRVFSTYTTISVSRTTTLVRVSQKPPGWTPQPVSTKPTPSYTVHCGEMYTSGLTFGP